MKTERKYAKVIVSEKGKRHADTGHPWVFDNDIVEYIGEYENGDIVDVLGPKDKYLGSGFINNNSKIRVRIISKNSNDTFDEAFFERRLRYAFDYRKNVMGEQDYKCCRLIFGEADQFPGLTVDRFNDIIVTQTLSLGIEKIKPMLFNLIYKILNEDGQDIIGIYERNDVAIRNLEGMEENKGYFKIDNVDTPTRTTTEIIENGISYKVDVENGQKTGFFLDQKYNRKSLWQLSRGKNVLDCFTHTGSFALNAAKAGAKHVHAVDISESAIEMARENARINGLEKNMSFEAVDVFELLPNIKQGEYDLIILDPPAFTKSRKTVDSATRGYKEINYRAMKALPRGGYLATCSCSHFMDNDKFEEMLVEAAKDADVCLRQIEVRAQSADHPILWNVPETAYLKFYIFQVV
jgi:23S rRNA (cytosine1962-C5)-methyltransferase